MLSRLSRLAVVVAVLAMAGSSVARAATLTIDPGTYGSYLANGSVVRYGNYSFRPLGGGTIWQDRTGIQAQDLGVLADGTYEIWARDANVVIGSFVNTGGNPSNATGSVTLAGNTLSFVNHDIRVGGSGLWTWPNAKIFNVAWGEVGVARFVLPAGNDWDGWWGVINDNSFDINVDSSGNVTVAAQSPNIGITGGAGVLNFPVDGIRQVRVTAPAIGNWWSLDWATGNLPSSTTFDLFLYPGLYRLATGVTGSWSPNNQFTVPLAAAYQTVTFTHDGITGPVTFLIFPEPSAALLLALTGAGALLRRRR